MSVTTLLIVLLILLLVGAFPAYSYNRDWGYGPWGGVGLILLILIIILFFRR